MTNNRKYKRKLKFSHSDSILINLLAVSFVAPDNFLKLIL